jgi:hypothetical protein
VELATVMSVAFSLCFTVLWFTQYGERHYMKRYLSDFNPNDEHSRLAAAAAAAAAEAAAGGSKKSKAAHVEAATPTPAPQPPADPPAAGPEGPANP